MPNTRIFTTRSFGPGAVPSIRDLVRSLEAVQEDSDPATYINPGQAQFFARGGNNSDEIWRLLRAVQDIQRREPLNEAEKITGRDPTWGYYVFVTDYSRDVVEKIPQAVDHLIEVTRRGMRAESTSASSDEAYRRFKLVVVLDEEVLSGASDDRVREEFRAHLRMLGMLQWLDEQGSLIGPHDSIELPARNYACLVFDRSAVFMLADIFFPEDIKEDYTLFERKAIKVVDAWWKRPATNVTSYRGVGRCPITFLPGFYEELTDRANSGAMEDLCDFASSSLSSMYIPS